MSLLFNDAFDELTDKMTQLISKMCLNYSILYLLCKFHGNVLSGSQDIAYLLLEYFNSGYPVDQQKTLHQQNDKTEQCRL